MNDRFKFRAWSNKENKMYNVHSLHIGTNKAIVTALYGNASITLDDKVLMQSTGLHDKNGKLIYEGDIVRIFHLSSTGQPRTYISEVYYYKVKPSFQVKGYGFIDEDDVVEVIGNIYENKELLNE